MTDTWLPADVYFGDTETALPDWRKEESPSDKDDDAEPSEEEKQAVEGMLGFCPTEIEEGDSEEE